MGDRLSNFANRVCSVLALLLLGAAAAPLASAQETLQRAQIVSSTFLCAAAIAVFVSGGALRLMLSKRFL